MSDEREAGNRQASHQAQHEAFTVIYYRRSDVRIDRASVRSAYGDAAHMCAAIAADIERENMTRGGRTSAHGRPTKLRARRVAKLQARDMEYEANRNRRSR